ncbi:MAG: LLM class flavin-dependent oxidoreductase [Gammaproteobacteria bacterium]
MAALRFGVYCEMQSAPDKSHPELAWEVFRLIEHADTLGYDVYSLIEHHFFPSFGISANPLGLFTAVAQRTQQIRLRTLCHTLPLRWRSARSRFACAPCATRCRCTTP